MFSVTLKKINVFLNLESISSSSLDSDESKSRRATLTVYSKNISTLAQFSSHSQNSMYDKNHHLNFHQMKKKFQLTAFTTQEDLEVYRQSKNVDSVTILSFRYFKFLNVFFKKNVDILSLHQAHDHVIHLKENAQFSVFALYNMSRDEILELHRYLNENLSKDFIRVSRFQTIISVLFIKKFEEELCFCVNYRDLNAIIVKNWYSLSLISETLNCLSRAKIFTKLNIISAFNRLWIKEEDEALIVFCTRFELFKYLVMLFDLCNESVSFQKYINNTLREHLDKFCTAYLNDILIYFDNELEHKIHVKLILRKLREADLQMNIIKCKFHVTQVSYLELIIIIKEIKMNSSKIDIIVNWLILINVKDVQSFLDFANFYRRFIYDYSRIAISLTHLIRKDVFFVWSQKCQVAFNILKKVFTFKIILRHYNSNHKIVVEINALNYVFKDIFSQYDENEILHSVAYFSKKHNSVECNYEIYDKKLMIIVCTFEKWWSELEDSIYSVEMITNHKNLEYFMSTKQLSCHQARWSEFLSRFNYCIAYHFDKIDDKLNALTRRSEDLSKERDTFDSQHQYQHQTILKTHVLDLNIVENLTLDVFDIKVMKLQSQIIALDSVQLHLFLIISALSQILALMNLEIKEFNVEDVESQLDQDILNLNEDSADILTQTLWKQVEINDKFAAQIIEALCNEARHHNKISLVECEEHKNHLYFQERKYVLNSDKLRFRIIQLIHDSVVDDHSEKAKSYELISWVYWWSNIYKYVQRFVQNCHVCTRFKLFKQQTQEWLCFLSVSERRWRDIFMNYVDSLSLSIFISITYRYVLIFVDHFIKMKHLVFITSMKVEKAINYFYAHVWKHHDLLEFFVSDRDTQFIFNVWKHMCKMLKIDVKLSTTYHSEIDDQIERVNAVMKHYLRVFVNYMQNDWAKWLSEVEFVVNNTSSSITLASFFLINSSQNSRLDFEFSESLLENLTFQAQDKLINVEEFIKKMKKLTEHLRDEMLITQIIYEFHVNLFRRSCFRYFVEDEVWLNARNLSIAHLVVKLDDHNVDFFKIKRVFKNNSLVIELNLSIFMKIHSVFHVTLLSHIASDFLSSQRQKPRELVVVENDERFWYVNSILNFKRDRCYNSLLLKYYVDWEDHFSTWESFNLLNNCEQALNEYHLVNSVIEESHVLLCVMSQCQCQEL